MILKELKKLSLSEILVLVLLIIILLQRCSGKTPENPTGPQITRDTVWVNHSSTITTKPQLIKSEPYPVPIDRWNTEYLPDTNYTKLLDQYKRAVTELLGVNYYKDSLHIDSLGYVIVKDTISKNVLVGRRFSYDLHYPIIKETKTITVIEPPKRQLYLGGTLEGNQFTILNQIKAGVLYKNKKDQIYGLSVGLDGDSHIQFGLSSYWKISFRNDKNK